MFVNQPSIHNFFSHSIVFHTVFYNGLRKGEGGTKEHDCVLIACNDLIRIKVFEPPGILIQKQVILRTESEDIPVCGVSVFNIWLFNVNDKIVFSFLDELSTGISPIIFSYLNLNWGFWIELGEIDPISKGSVSTCHEWEGDLYLSAKNNVLSSFSISVILEKRHCH